MKIGIMFCCVLFSSQAFGQTDSLKTDWDKIIVGKWVNKINRTMDGKEYFDLKCRDTIQYSAKGNYISNQCVWNETGKWKFSKDKELIIHYDINNQYWKKELGTDDLGESHAPVISLSKSELVTVILDEEKGEVHQFYVRLK
ncbi:MAG: hypothetical protein ABJN84_17405 [Flavobacteriaceae bacterium]